MSLRDDGFRFIYRKGRFEWTHPSLLEPNDIDCTEMDDVQFEDFVEECALSWKEEK